MATTMTTCEILELKDQVATGLSSRGLLTWLVESENAQTPYTFDLPWDDSDLGRCERTYAALSEADQKACAGVMDMFRTRVAELNARYEAQKAADKAQQAKAKAADEDSLAKAKACTLELTGPEAHLLRHILDNFDPSYGLAEDEDEIAKYDSLLEAIARKLS